MLAQSYPKRLRFRFRSLQPPADAPPLERTNERTLPLSPSYLPRLHSNWDRPWELGAAVRWGRGDVVDRDFSWGGRGGRGWGEETPPPGCRAVSARCLRDGSTPPPVPHTLPPSGVCPRPVRAKAAPRPPLCRMGVAGNLHAALFASTPPPSPHSLSPSGSLLSGPANDVTLGGGSVSGKIPWFYGVVDRNFDGGGWCCLGGTFKCVSEVLGLLVSGFIYNYYKNVYRILSPTLLGNFGKQLT